MPRSNKRSDYSLSVVELEQREDEQLRLADIVIRRSYARKVKQALERLKFNKQSDRLAEELLTGDKQVEDILDGQDRGQWENIIRNACKEYQGLRDITFLLISAPRTHTCLSIEQDRQAREKQMLNFYNIITYNRDKEKCIKLMPTIHTYKNLLQHLKDFMLEDAAKSKRAYVVFNGHGKNTGHLSLEDEVDPVSNSVFIEDIHKAWKMCKQKSEEAGDKVILPERISVVLAHCYGYKHQVRPDSTAVIDVVCLTNAHNPETKFVYKLNTTGQKVTDALHIELTNYARDVVKQESLESEASDDCATSKVESEESTVCSGPVSNIIGDDIESDESQSNRILPPLDVTTLACLSFNSNIEQPFVFPRTTTSSRSRPISVLPGIQTLEINVSPKRVSDYFRSAKSAASCVEQMALLGASVHMAIGSRDNEIVESSQAVSHGTADALKSTAQLSTMPLAINSDMAAIEIKDTTIEIKDTACGKATYKQKLPTKKTKKKMITKSKTIGGIGACAALVGISAPLGQMAQSMDINIPEKQSMDMHIPEKQCMDINIPEKLSMDKNIPEKQSMDVNIPEKQCMNVNIPKKQSMDEYDC